jgi:hypothetical protein
MQADLPKNQLMLFRSRCQKYSQNMLKANVIQALSEKSSKNIMLKLIHKWISLLEDMKLEILLLIMNLANPFSDS